MLDIVTQAKFEATLPQIQPVSASYYRKTLYTKETAETEPEPRECVGIVKQQIPVKHGKYIQCILKHNISGR